MTGVDGLGPSRWSIDVGDTVADIAWSPTDGRIGIGCSGGEVVVVNETGDTVDRRLPHRSGTSCVTWFDGEVASGGVDGGPEPGVHNYHRGGPLTVFDLSARDAIAQLDGIIDGARALAVWDTAISSEWDGSPVWVHGDMTGSNLLATDGRLAAVIDFGCCAIGDPACDLGIAWTLLDPPARDRFVRSLHFDDGCWYRAKGWVLWKALRGLVTQPADHPRNTGERLGWRWTSLVAIETLTGGDGAP
jgi:hypothetical protein